MNFLQSQQSGFAKCETNTKNKIIVIKGFFNYYDDFNRAKLMFLDDYDDDDEGVSAKSFTKSFIINKSKNAGNNPLSKDGECFFIKCKKGQVGLIDQPCLEKNTNNQITTKPQTRLVPVIELLQHKVECVVQINNYRFKKNGELIVGWNLKLLNIKLLEW
jgi:hypothetical protein